MERTDDEGTTDGRTDHRILQEHETGAKCSDLCRKHGMSEFTSYAWKAKYSGMTVFEAERLKALEEENAKLKKLLAEQTRRNAQNCWSIGAAYSPLKRATVSA